MVLCGALGLDLSPGAPRHFAWQAWHLVTSTFVSRGRRGTNSHPPPFCVAGVALMVLCGALGPDLSPGAPRHFAWQAWYLVTSTFVSRGRRGANYIHTYIHTYRPTDRPTYILTYILTYIHTYIHTYIPFYLLDLSPSPLSFFASLSPLKPLKLIFGRS